MVTEIMVDNSVITISSDEDDDDDDDDDVCVVLASRPPKSVSDDGKGWKYVTWFTILVGSLRVACKIRLSWSAATVGASLET